MCIKCTHRSLWEQWLPSLVTNIPDDATGNRLVTSSFQDGVHNQRKFKSLHPWDLVMIKNNVPTTGQLSLSNLRPSLNLPSPLQIKH